nr:unnamed protein product [Spirometra erinaceieuropaei]
MRVRGKLSEWIEDFLIGRSQIVRLGDQRSAASVGNKVTKDSVRGPILFLMNIDDYIRGLDCEITMFADYRKLWNVIRNDDDDDDGAKIPADKDRPKQWSNQWLLPFNVAKCNILRSGAPPPSAGK